MLLAVLEHPRMRLFPAAAVLATLLLAGCTEEQWSNLVSYPDANKKTATAQPFPPDTPQPVATVGAVAAQDLPPASPTPAPVIPQSSSPPAASQPQVVTAATPVPRNALCQGSALQAASENDFDAATRQHVYERSLEQCMALFGTTTGQ